MRRSMSDVWLAGSVLASLSNSAINASKSIIYVKEVKARSQQPCTYSIAMGFLIMPNKFLLTWSRIVTTVTFKLRTMSSMLGDAIKFILKRSLISKSRSASRVTDTQLSPGRSKVSDVATAS